jgi:hypothetical protein
MRHFFILNPAVAIVVLAACSAPATSIPTPMPVSTFKLIVLNGSWHDHELGYEGEPAQAALTAADARSPLFVIGTGQIEDYDWNLQTITLTGQATVEFGEALSGAEGIPPQDIQ